MGCFFCLVPLHNPDLPKQSQFPLFFYCQSSVRALNPSRTRCKNSEGPIAQLVEQRIENPCVPGSIPGRATT